jgi:hypothetical protein
MTKHPLKNTSSIEVFGSKIVFYIAPFLLLFNFFFQEATAQSTVVFASPGTTTWTVPECVTEITVQVWGGGGGGGGALAILRNSGDGETCVGGGGGGGGGFSSSVLAVVPGQVYTIVVGAGGTAGTSGAGSWNGGISTPAGNGGIGGISSFSGNGYNVQSTGGNGGNGASGYNTSNDADLNVVGTGGAGGAGSGGTINFNGGNGSASVFATFGIDKSGAGGGAAGPGGNGANGTAGGGTVNPPGGAGQAPGGNGANGTFRNLPSNGGNNGANGNIIGGGAAGGLQHQGGFGANARAGGAGARGEVRIIFTLPPQPTPTFAPVPPICTGESLSPLPTISNEGITGTWAPALDNTATTTYTFTPDPGQCALTTALTITVNNGITPLFNPPAPICSGETAPTLPSVSNNGISGSWNPLPVSNTGSGTYTFTPNPGQCAVSTTLDVIVNPPTIPVFAPLPPICEGETPPLLPTVSNNGISGSWNPAVISNTVADTYTFTPNPGQCASSVTVSSTLEPLPATSIIFHD